MVTWSAFEAAVPDMATEGRRLLHARGGGKGLLATVRENNPPRIHPVTVGVVDGRLYTFVIVGSAKLADLERDGRFALHAHVDPAVPSEFSIRGRATLVSDPGIRSRVAAAWPFTADDGYALFELGLESALLGVLQAAGDWPPHYSRWSA